MIDQIDEIQYRIDSLRDELLKLYGMAHDLINDADPDGPPPEYPIWELADEISTAIWEWPSHLEDVRVPVDKLAELAPDLDEGISRASSSYP